MNDIRPRIPARLARRIDRLARRAHAFHRFAHHPLCDRYRGELVRWGRSSRLCRGCLLAALGAAVGAVSGVLLAPRVPLAFAVLGAGAALALASRLLRLPKLASRFAPVVAGAFAACGGPVPGALATLLLLAYVWRYRRAGPDRGPCRDCPERAERICSGFAPMVRRERAFERLAARWIRGARLSTSPLDAPTSVKGSTGSARAGADPCLPAHGNGRAELAGRPP